MSVEQVLKTPDFQLDLSNKTPDSAAVNGLLDKKTDIGECTVIEGIKGFAEYTGEKKDEIENRCQVSPIAISMFFDKQLLPKLDS